MSIESYIKRVIKNDKMVYWGTPTVGNDASYTFATPIEVSCFWREETNLIKNDDGRESISKAAIYINQDLEEKGMVFHGALSDLTTAQKNDPRTITNAYEIMMVRKLPSLHLYNQFLRQVFI